MTLSLKGIVKNCVVSLVCICILGLSALTLHYRTDADKVQASDVNCIIVEPTYFPEKPVNG